MVGSFSVWQEVGFLRSCARGSQKLGNEFQPQTSLSRCAVIFVDELPSLAVEQDTMFKHSVPLPKALSLRLRLSPLVTSRHCCLLKHSLEVARTEQVARALLFGVLEASVDEATSVFPGQVGRC